MRHLLVVRHTETERHGEQAVGSNNPASAADFARSMAEAGVLIGASAPRRGRDHGRPAPHDGSYLIDVADTDEAVGWASRHPGAGRRVIEVRPVWAWAGMG
jgi:hypothetical protein